MSGKIHHLKTDPKLFQASWDGKRPFEIRKNDRDFTHGDFLVLEETKYTGEEMANGQPLVYTGRLMLVSASHVLAGSRHPSFGLDDEWVVIGIDTKVGENGAIFKATITNVPNGWVEIVKGIVEEFGANRSISE